MRDPIRVCVVDVFPMLLEGIAALLEPALDLVVAAVTRDYRLIISLCLQHRPDVLLLGMDTPNAGTWWGQAKDYVTWDTSDTPSNSKPNIACWTGSPGHVAYAGNYSGGTDVDITEMSWCDFCDQTREISIWDPTGFAYRHTFP